jgi:hypothetical protein
MHFYIYSQKTFICSDHNYFRYTVYMFQICDKVMQANPTKIEINFHQSETVCKIEVLHRII